MKKTVFVFLMLGTLTACSDGTQVKVDQDLDSIANKAENKLDTLANKVEAGAEKAWDSTKVGAAKAWDSTKAKAKNLKERLNERIDRERDSLR